MAKDVHFYQVALVLLKLFRQIGKNDNIQYETYNNRNPTNESSIKTLAGLFAKDVKS